MAAEIDLSGKIEGLDISSNPLISFRPQENLKPNLEEIPDDVVEKSPLGDQKEWAVLSEQSFSEELSDLTSWRSKNGSNLQSVKDVDLPPEPDDVIFQRAMDFAESHGFGFVEWEDNSKSNSASDRQYSPFERKRRTHYERRRQTQYRQRFHGVGDRPTPVQCVRSSQPEKWLRKRCFNHTNSQNKSFQEKMSARNSMRDDIAKMMQLLEHDNSDVSEPNSGAYRQSEKKQGKDEEGTKLSEDKKQRKPIVITNDDLEKSDILADHGLSQDDEVISTDAHEDENRLLIEDDLSFLPKFQGNYQKITNRQYRCHNSISAALCRVKSLHETDETRQSALPNTNLERGVMEIVTITEQQSSPVNTEETKLAENSNETSTNPLQISPCKKISYSRSRPTTKGYHTSLNKFNDRSASRSDIMVNKYPKRSSISPSKTRNTSKNHIRLGRTQCEQGDSHKTDETAKNVENNEKEAENGEVSTGHLSSENIDTSLRFAVTNRQKDLTSQSRQRKFRSLSKGRRIFKCQSSGKSLGEEQDVNICETNETDLNENKNAVNSFDCSCNDFLINEICIFDTDVFRDTIAKYIDNCIKVAFKIVDCANKEQKNPPFKLVSNETDNGVKESNKNNNACVQDRLKAFKCIIPCITFCVSQDNIVRHLKNIEDFHNYFLMINTLGNLTSDISYKFNKNNNCDNDNGFSLYFSNNALPSTTHPTNKTSRNDYGEDKLIRASTDTRRGRGEDGKTLRLPPIASNGHRQLLHQSYGVESSHDLNSSEEEKLDKMKIAKSVRKRINQRMSQKRKDLRKEPENKGGSGDLEAKNGDCDEDIRQLPEDVCVTTKIMSSKPMDANDYFPCLEEHKTVNPSKSYVISKTNRKGQMIYDNDDETSKIDRLEICFDEKRKERDHFPTPRASLASPLFAKKHKNKHGVREKIEIESNLGTMNQLYVHDLDYDEKLEELHDHIVNDESFNDNNNNNNNNSGTESSSEQSDDREESLAARNVTSGQDLTNTSDQVDDPYELEIGPGTVSNASDNDEPIYENDILEYLPNIINSNVPSPLDELNQDDVMYQSTINDNVSNCLFDSRIEENTPAFDGDNSRSLSNICNSNDPSQIDTSSLIAAVYELKMPNENISNFISNATTDENNPDCVDDSIRSLVKFFNDYKTPSPANTANQETKANECFDECLVSLQAMCEGDDVKESSSNLLKCASFDESNDARALPNTIENINNILDNSRTETDKPLCEDNTSLSLQNVARQDYKIQNKEDVESVECSTSNIRTSCHHMSSEPFSKSRSTLVPAATSSDDVNKNARYAISDADLIDADKYGKGVNEEGSQKHLDKSTNTIHGFATKGIHLWSQDIDSKSTVKYHSKPPNSLTRASESRRDNPHHQKLSLREPLLPNDPSDFSEPAEMEVGAGHQIGPINIHQRNCPYSPTTENYWDTTKVDNDKALKLADIGNIGGNNMDISELEIPELDEQMDEGVKNIEDKSSSVYFDIQGRLYQTCQQLVQTSRDITEKVGCLKTFLESKFITTLPRDDVEMPTKSTQERTGIRLCVEEQREQVGGPYFELDVSKKNEKCLDKNVDKFSNKKSDKEKFPTMKFAELVSNPTNSVPDEDNFENGSSSTVQVNKKISGKLKEKTQDKLEDFTRCNTPSLSKKTSVSEKSQNQLEKSPKLAHPRCDTPYPPLSEKSFASENYNDSECNNPIKTLSEKSSAFRNELVIENGSTEPVPAHNPRIPFKQTTSTSRPKPYRRGEHSRACRRRRQTCGERCHLCLPETPTTGRSLVEVKTLETPKPSTSEGLTGQPITKVTFNRSSSEKNKINGTRNRRSTTNKSKIVATKKRVMRNRKIENVKNHNKAKKAGNRTKTQKAKNQTKNKKGKKPTKSKQKTKAKIGKTKHRRGKNNNKCTSKSAFVCRTSIDSTFGRIQKKKKVSDFKHAHARPVNSKIARLPKLKKGSAQSKQRLRKFKRCITEPGRRKTPKCGEFINQCNGHNQVVGMGISTLASNIYINSLVHNGDQDVEANGGVNYSMVVNENSHFLVPRKLMEKLMSSFIFKTNVEKNTNPSTSQWERDLNSSLEKIAYGNKSKSRRQITPQYIPFVCTGNNIDEPSTSQWERDLNSKLEKLANENKSNESHQVTQQYKPFICAAGNLNFNEKRHIALDETTEPLQTLCEEGDAEAISVCSLCQLKASTIDGTKDAETLLGLSEQSIAGSERPEVMASCDDSGNSVNFVKMVEKDLESLEKLVEICDKEKGANIQTEELESSLTAVCHNSVTSTGSTATTSETRMSKNMTTLASSKYSIGTSLNINQNKTISLDRSFISTSDIGTEEQNVKNCDIKEKDGTSIDSSNKNDKPSQRKYAPKMHSHFLRSCASPVIRKQKTFTNIVAGSSSTADNSESNKMVKVSEKNSLGNRIIGAHSCLEPMKNKSYLILKSGASTSLVMSPSRLSSSSNQRCLKSIKPAQTNNTSVQGYRTRRSVLRKRQERQRYEMLRGIRMQKKIPPYWLRSQGTVNFADRQSTKGSDIDTYADDEQSSSGS